MLDTSVALSVFDRPDLTELVFQTIARARPKRLFVFADGPRSFDEAERCAQARGVAEGVNWTCDVSFDYSEVNLGARRRYASGVSWVFSHVKEAVFLDDDCVPDPSFFRFCEELLDHYRDDTRVMMVTGSNYLQRWKQDRQSFHFSNLGSPWGWASWKRAWNYYDITMAAWGDHEIRARIMDVLADEGVFAFQSRRFDRLYGEPEDRHSWDLPWSFARLIQSGLTIVPAANLVSNLGNRDGRGVPPTHPPAQLKGRADDVPPQDPYLRRRRSLLRSGSHPADLRVVGDAGSLSLPSEAELSAHRRDRKRSRSRVVAARSALAIEELPPDTLQNPMNSTGRCDTCASATVSLGLRYALGG